MRRELLRLAAELRVMGPEQYADRLERVAALLAPRPLRGIVASMSQPATWPTPELVAFLCDRLMAADEVIAKLLPDAEITGSDVAIALAKAWRASLDLDS